MKDIESQILNNNKISKVRKHFISPLSASKFSETKNYSCADYEIHNRLDILINKMSDGEIDGFKKQIKEELFCDLSKFSAIGNEKIKAIFDKLKINPLICFSNNSKDEYILNSNAVNYMDFRKSINKIYDSTRDMYYSINTKNFIDTMDKLDKLKVAIGSQIKILNETIDVKVEIINLAENYLNKLKKEIVYFKVKENKESILDSVKKNKERSNRDMGDFRRMDFEITLETLYRLESNNEDGRRDVIFNILDKIRAQRKEMDYEKIIKLVQKINGYISLQDIHPEFKDKVKEIDNNMIDLMSGKLVIGVNGKIEQNTTEITSDLDKERKELAKNYDGLVNKLDDLVNYIEKSVLFSKNEMKDINVAKLKVQ